MNKALRNDSKGKNQNSNPERTTPESGRLPKWMFAQVDVRVGKRIRKRRILQAMTLRELGERIGITAQQIQKYEEGQGSVKASRLVALAKALGVQPQYFFTKPPALEPPPESELSPGLQEPQPTWPDEYDRKILELLKAYLAIKNDKVQRSIVCMIREVSRMQD